MAHGDLKPSNIFITEDGQYKLGISIFFWFIYILGDYNTVRALDPEGKTTQVGTLFHFYYFYYFVLFLFLFVFENND
jgi:serine/threonine protein kinase